MLAYCILAVSVGQEDRCLVRARFGRRRSDMHVTLEQAQKAIAAAIDKAKELETCMDIAVVDSGANLKAFVRMGRC
jgi:hypothetical protein